MTVVRIDNLTVRIPTLLAGEPATVSALTEVTTSLEAGRVRALVGESGCGKSVLGLALMGMLPPRTRATGSLTIDGDELLHAPEKRWRAVRGRVVALVPQSSATSLTPTRTAGRQLAETVCELTGTRASADELAERARRVGLAPEALARYPHELSGGMAQRVGVALALAGNPRVIVADEPTASLDAELADQVLCLLGECARQGAAVLLITHDLRSLERTGVADEVWVMYAGRIVEQGAAGQVLQAPRHDYTRALIGALPEHGLVPIPGMPPSLTNLDPSVRFADRLAAAGAGARR